uniref:Putative lipoprotein Ypar23 n=2 Tax=Aquipseudomonas alcaligenes TaxID=43263 RepID=Q939F0_AQUAC|nr:putative lipoprotein Ypar23 [Pseudomonas alcaligenes]
MPIRFVLLLAVMLLAACSSKQNSTPKCTVSVPPPPVPESSDLCSGEKCNWEVLFPSGKYPVSTEGCRAPVVQQKRPSYPREAFNQCIEGHALVAVFLGHDGVQTSAKLLQSSNKIFDQSALLQASRIFFEPMKCQSELYDSVVLMPLIYRLQPK